jgi:hypothetical protein
MPATPVVPITTNLPVRLVFYHRGCLPRVEGFKGDWVATTDVPTERQECGRAEDVPMMLDHLVGAYLMCFVKNA